MRRIDGEDYDEIELPAEDMRDKAAPIAAWVWFGTFGVLSFRAPTYDDPGEWASRSETWYFVGVALLLSLVPAIIAFVAGRKLLYRPAIKILRPRQSLTAPPGCNRPTTEH